MCIPVLYNQNITLRQYINKTVNYGLLHFLMYFQAFMYNNIGTTVFDVYCYIYSK